jgi:hypothetical protein
MGSNPDSENQTEIFVLALMAGNVEIGDEVGETESPSYNIWQFFTVSHLSDANKGGAKNEV